MSRLEGKVALVTGGAGGIGKAVAERFVLEGARVWIADLPECLDRAAIPREQGVAIDVTDRASIDAAVSGLARSEGRIDILVTGAGIYGLEPWLQITEAEWDRILAVNARGTAFSIQAVAAAMIERGLPASIVCVASAAGRQGDAEAVAYSASKAAVISITQSAAIGLARYGIRVNAVAPGPVTTAMWAQVLDLRDRTDGVAQIDFEAAVASRIPMARKSTPEEQVGAILFLASGESGYITGQTVNVDGGLYCN